MRQAAGDALDVAGLAAQGDFALGVGVEQFAPEQGHDRRRKLRVGRSMPRQEKFGCSPRMTRKIPIDGAWATAVAPMSLAGGLGAAGDEIDAQLGDRPCVSSERMSEMQQRVDAHQRVVVASAVFHRASTARRSAPAECRSSKAAKSCFQSSGS